MMIDNLKANENIYPKMDGKSGKTQKAILSKNMDTMRNECRNFQNSVWIPMDDLIIQAIRKESADSKGFERDWTC